MKDALQPLKGKCRKVSILIGPEGGLTCEEVALAKAAGGSIVTLVRASFGQKQPEW